MFKFGMGIIVGVCLMVYMGISKSIRKIETVGVERTIENLWKGTGK